MVLSATSTVFKMPGKKNNQQKKGGSKGRKNAPRSRLGLSLIPMKSMHVNLLFKQEKTISESAAGVGAANWYRINGAFDPDQSAAGPSALGFNQYAALFLNYRVHAMRIHVEGMLGAGAVGNHFAAVTLTPNPRQVTLPSDPALWGGEPGSISKTLVYCANGGKNTVILDKTYRPWEVMKITKQQYENDMDFSSLVTTLPTLECFVALGVNGIASSTTMSLVSIVTISYDVEFFNPVLLV